MSNLSNSYLLKDWIKEVEELDDQAFHELKDNDLNFLNDLETRHKEDENYILSERQRDYLIDLVEKYL